MPVLSFTIRHLKCIAGIVTPDRGRIVLGDRVLFVDGGQILEQGTPDEVFNHPKEKRTQDFLSKVL